MNKNERKVKSLYESKGYIVLRDGWPDFLAYRMVNGKLEAKAIEVKAGNDAVSMKQIRNHVALEALGIPVEVHHVIGEKNSRDMQICKCGKNRAKWLQMCRGCWDNLSKIKELPVHSDEK
jgi:VRR-NUC domain